MLLHELSSCALVKRDKYKTRIGGNFKRAERNYREIEHGIRGGEGDYIRIVSMLSSNGLLNKIDAYLRK